MNGPIRSVGEAKDAMIGFNTNGTGPSTETVSDPLCHACGRPVDLRHQNVLVEVVEKLTPQQAEAIVWHQDCYEQDLDDGEEC